MVMTVMEAVDTSRVWGNGSVKVFHYEVQFLGASLKNEFSKLNLISWSFDQTVLMTEVRSRGPLSSSKYNLPSSQKTGMG